jgi:hypothetical protein
MAGRRKDHVVSFAPRCPAEKAGFIRKKDAQRFAKQRGLTDVRAYRCNHTGCDYWHLGHLPKHVLTGRMDRHDLWPARSRAERSGRSTP